MTWWSKTTDCAASRSRFGVRIVGFPYAPRWSRRNVSETTSTMFIGSPRVRPSSGAGGGERRLEARRVCEQPFRVFGLRFVEHAVDVAELDDPAGAHHRHFLRD